MKINQTQELAFIQTSLDSQYSQIHFPNDFLKFYSMKFLLKVVFPLSHQNLNPKLLRRKSILQSYQV